MRDDGSSVLVSSLQLLVRRGNGRFNTLFLDCLWCHFMSFSCTLLLSNAMGVGVAVTVSSLLEVAANLNRSIRQCDQQCHMVRCMADIPTA